MTVFAGSDALSDAVLSVSSLESPRVGDLVSRDADSSVTYVVVASSAFQLRAMSLKDGVSAYLASADVTVVAQEFVPVSVVEMFMRLEMKHASWVGDLVADAHDYADNNDLCDRFDEFMRKHELPSRTTVESVSAWIRVDFEMEVERGEGLDDGLVEEHVKTLFGIHEDMYFDRYEVDY